MHNSTTESSQSIGIQIISSDESETHAGSGRIKKIRAIEQGKEVFLVEKRPSIYGVLPRNQADSYIQLWETLKEAGLPVVDRVKKASATSVYLPDLTRDGSWLYGKADMHLLKIGGRSRNPTDQHLLKSSQFTSNITEKVQKVVDLADEENITLPVDDPLEILVHPDGTWELVVLDIDMAKLGEAKNEAVVNRMKETVEEIQNQLRTNSFIKTHA